MWLVKDDHSVSVYNVERLVFGVKEGFRILNVIVNAYGAAITGRQTIKMKNLLSILFFMMIVTACNSVAADDNQIELTELIGTNWILKSIKGHPPIADRIISLQISVKNFSGSAGCNRYFSKYTVTSQNSFTIDELASNQAECIEPEGIMEQETQYLELLSSAIKYQLVEQELILEDEQGKAILRYQLRQEFDVTPDSLIGKTWQLISAPDLYEDRLSEFSIRFDEGAFSGTTVCREYEGKYLAEEDNFQITVMGMTTDYSCNEKDGHAEAQYTTLLANVEQYNVTSDQLELFTRHGEKLVYKLVLNDR